MRLNETGKAVLEARCLQRGETPKGMVDRVAKAVASIEEDREWEEIFHDMIYNLDFLPNTPTLMNAGRPIGQLSACFVLPIEDSMHGIFTALYNQAMVQKSGGGTGFNFSPLRPRGATVSSTQGVSSGPVSFMRIFNAASQEVEQGGTRRGASMGCMSVYHPDIMEFITCKDKEGEFKNFNISVLIDDAFIEAIRLDRNINLHHPVHYLPSKSIRAQEVWDLLTQQAWKNGEPGVIFIDTIRANHPIENILPIEATNPCGEQPLTAYESCNLGSINLANMYDSCGADDIDWSKLLYTTRRAVRFLDNVIDINTFPLPKIKEVTLRTRKIGLGVMGWHSLLLKAGISYDSNLAVNLARTIMQEIRTQALETSADLADEKGTYPLRNDYKELPYRRNLCLTTIAPTGSLATIAGVSYGIEPIFALTYRKRMVDKEFTEVNEQFMKEVDNHFPDIDVIEVAGVTYVNTIRDTGTCQQLYGLPDDLRHRWKTASEIPWERHIQMQAAFQEFTDNAVSKTINMSSSSTVEDVSKALLYAHEKGCKGITIYRASSRKEEAVSTGTKIEEVIETEEPSKRPERLTGSTIRKDTPHGRMYLTVNSVEGEPFEVFAQIGKAGSDVSGFTEAVGRLISMLLRYGVPAEKVGEQLLGIGGSTSVGFGPNKVTSVPDAIGKVLLQEFEHEELIEEYSNGDICPQCGKAALIKQESCINCTSCTYTRC